MNRLPSFLETTIGLAAAIALVGVAIWAAPRDSKVYIDDYATVCEVAVESGGDAMVRGGDMELIKPDPNIVPGSFFKQVTLDDIKAVGYSKRVRDVPESLKRTICERDGVKWADHDRYEIDHKIPLSLGGTNAPSNLWCQPRFGEWNALQKDAVERRALQKVRDEDAGLREMQTAFALDWVALAKHLWIGGFGDVHIPEEEIGADEQ